MKRYLALILMLFYSSAAHAHRLDEYLQATILSVAQDHLQASMRLIPGAAVASTIITAIDRDGDGLFSAAEQTAYAERVLADLTLSIDGLPIKPRLFSATFPNPAQMREGLGEIHLEFTAELPPGGLKRSLRLENHHLQQGSAYLVNALVPHDPNLRIVAQKRDELQTAYELDFVQSKAATAATSRTWWGAGALTGAMFLFTGAFLRQSALHRQIQSSARADGSPLRP